MNVVVVVEVNVVVVATVEVEVASVVVAVVDVTVLVPGTTDQLSETLADATPVPVEFKPVHVYVVSSIVK